MKRLRWMVLAMGLVWTLMIPANSCGPFFTEAVFTRPGIPEKEQQYVTGRLGVLQSTYWRKYLVVAYLWLSGRGLSKAEQAQANGEDAAQGFSTWGGGDAAPPAGPADWAMFSGAVTRKLPGSDYEYFPNCLPGAFKTAGQTMADRQQRYGAASAEVADWLAGQKAVFSNCGGAGTMPAAAPEKASLWLKQDRGYQMASAQFYATDYKAARGGFEAIAGDKGSPWHELAGYLAARATMRQATMTPEGKPADQALLAEAETKLRKLAADPAMQPIAATVQAYLGYVALRAHPDERAVELAARLGAEKADASFGQDLTDLLFYFDQHEDNTDARKQSALIDWVKAVNTGDRDHAMAMWRETHAQVWLMAALMLTPKPADGDAKASEEARELAEAARAVPVGAPGYTAATYYQLRLTPVKGTAADRRAELDRLIPGMEKTETASTINSFLQLRAGTAATLSDFLKDAAREPSGYNDGEEIDDAEPARPDVKEMVCGANVMGTAKLADAHRRFDTDGALVVNRRLPVGTMADAGLAGVLPEPLRFETAMAAWSRAVLLDEPKVAERLTKDLESCEPEMTPWLENYDRAATTDEREIDGLFALMQFPAMRPYVNDGWSRGEPISKYDELRDNWWCADVTGMVKGPNYFKADLGDGASADGKPKDPAELYSDPPFVEGAMRKQADGELERLAKMGSAPDYFAAAALGWVAKHPGDDRDADLLGYAKRVIRNGCRTKASSEWDHKLFLKLQKSYPNSTWAKKYKTWE
jgi:hypothetical protein